MDRVLGKRALQRASTVAEKPLPVSQRAHIGFRVSPDVVARFRAAVFAMRGAPLYLSMDGAAEWALAHVTEVLEKQHNKGSAFKSPQRQNPGAKY